MSASPHTFHRDGRPVETERSPKPTGDALAVETDPHHGVVRITRAPFAASAVYYHLTPRYLVAATDPGALLDHPAVSRDPDPHTIARFLGFRFDADERTFFRDVTELPPGHRLTVTPEHASVERTWRFDPVERAPAGSLDDSAAELVRRLSAAVAETMAGRDPSRVGISLSGGLDSTAVAAVAPRGVRAFSWTFEETPEGDERERIAAVAGRLGLPVTWVCGDGREPLRGDFFERFVHRGSPHVNPFAALKERLYCAAREAGCEQVLVGDGGDVLYAAREYWLRDLLADRRPGALAGLARTARRALRGDGFARLSLRRLLPRSPLPGGLRRKPAWLTPEARATLPPPALSPLLPPGRDPVRHELGLGAKNQILEGEELGLFDRCGVARGNPFWNRSLLQWALSLPAYTLHRDGHDKLLTRRALRDRLPPEILDGSRSGLLGAFYLRGLAARREALREMLFAAPISDWPRWVRRDWLEPYLDDLDRICFGHTILWRVIGYELWIRCLDGRPPDWDR